MTIGELILYLQRRKELKSEHDQLANNPPIEWWSNKKSKEEAKALGDWETKLNHLHSQISEIENLEL